MSEYYDDKPSLFTRLKKWWRNLFPPSLPTRELTLWEKEVRNYYDRKLHSELEKPAVWPEISDDDELPVIWKRKEK